jgi:hypothetical protein
MSTVTGTLLSLAETAAISSVLLTNVVLSGEPFQATAEVVENPVPVTVREKPGPPACTAEGESEDIAGTGLLDSGGL